MNIYKKLKKTLIVLSLVSFTSNNVFALPNDFDADGTSDMSVALVDRSKKTTAWLTKFSNGAAPKFSTFNLPADALVSMRYYAGDPKFYPGIVYVRSAKQTLEWYIKNSAGGDTLFRYGLPGDIIPNQGDFDCDGRDDATVVRNENGVLQWYIYRTASNTILKTPFGLAGDQVGVADTKGDCSAEMVALRNGYTWYTRDPNRNEFTTVQWGLNGDIPILPGDYDNDKLTDYLIFRRSAYVAGSQSAFIKFGKGTTGIITAGFDSSIPQIGKFSRFYSLAWSQRDTGWTAIRNQDDSKAVFLFGIPANAVIRADGTVVQPNDDGRFGAVTQVPGTPPPTGSPDPSVGTVASCSQTFSRGFLLKPAAQDTGGTRLGKPLILFTRNFPESSSCLNVIASNGKVIAKYGQYSFERYYSGWGCGSGLNASQIAQRAVAETGNRNIFIQEPGSNICWGPGPADGRTDNRR